MTVTDENFVFIQVHLLLKVPVKSNVILMSSVNVTCKDENIGEARVLIEQGTPPFIFDWGDNYPILEHDSFSVIKFIPGSLFCRNHRSYGLYLLDSVEV